MIIAYHGRARVLYMVGASSYRFGAFGGGGALPTGPMGFGILANVFGLRNRRPAAIFNRG